MDSSYVYLNYYRSSNGNEYLYVGSHSWNGPVGVLDPTYTGSSKIANSLRANWKPYKIELLEDTSNKDRLRVESEWIKKYCDLYGIADFAILLAPSYCSNFISQYKHHGKMLNLHSNVCEHLQDKDVQDRARATKRRNGTPFWSESARRNSCTYEAKSKMIETKRRLGELKMSDRCKDALTKPETRKKVIETRKKNGSWQRLMDDMVKKSHTPEVIAKQGETRRRHSLRARLDDGFEGNGHEIAEHTGLLYNSAKAFISLAHANGGYSLKQGPLAGLHFTPIPCLP